MLVAIVWSDLCCSLVLQAAAWAQTGSNGPSPAELGRVTTLPFDAWKAQTDIREEPAWVTLRGADVHAPACKPPSAEEVSRQGSMPDLSRILFRDPERFVAGQLHNFYAEWDKILPPNGLGDKARDWILNGVDVGQFFRSFKGKFRGQSYASDTPPSIIQPNARNCSQHEDFVSRTLEEWLKAGAIRVIGKVGEVEPPRLVMSLTVEPTKPRLCHDERFLNLWVRDLPFTLDTLADVPRLVGKGTFMTSVDHKAGYQHVSITPESQKFFGICWQGYYLVYCTLPFGFKASCFIYHTLTSLVASYARELGVPTLAYIDDSFNAEFRVDEEVTCDGRRHSARKAVYVMCDLWCRLGYTLSLSKSVLIPTQVLRFLGMLIDSTRGAFVLPDDKRAAFARLRDAILASKVTSLHTLQRLQGKCISFTLAVPGARLYVSEMNQAIAKAYKHSRPVQVAGDLRQEIEHWRFLDSWDGCSKWREERHMQIRIATDASCFKWGAMLLDLGNESNQEMSDFWPRGDSRPIHVKEAEALKLALVSIKDQIQDSRVDAYVDNTALLHAWGRQGCKDIHMARVLKSIFEVVSKYNVDLNLHYVPSGENPADAPSRRLSWSDAMLAPHTWTQVESCFGPHSVDLMATDANVMRRDGFPLKHYTPSPMPGSAGVNVFAQKISSDARPYCYPPICLLAPLLRYMKVSGVRSCTLIVPDMVPRPVWWPILAAVSKAKILIGRKGQKGVILVPTNRGYVPDEFGLKWDLLACRVVF